MAYDHQPKTLVGVRFVLFGFDPNHAQQVREKIVSEGGVDVGQYHPNCTTHVIVDNLVYDDPICVAARSDGKILVTCLWVDHSCEIRMPADHTNVLYRPPRDLGGIPGAESLVVCLTGYPRHLRDDIRTMISLMGAIFSKRLIAKSATHLICYEFEGYKYELAKKMQKIKIVNHQWLEDCLRAWKILPSENYDKSGYEVETMEVESKYLGGAEAIARKQCEDRKMDVSPCNLLNETVSVHMPPYPDKEVLVASASKGLSTSGNSHGTLVASAENSIPPQDPHEKQAQVMYRPLRDLGGIPGAKSLVVCVTGYQMHDREDILTKVRLIGARFSRDLITKKVTHLICNKFEGRKYEVAKKKQKIKLVNHHWLGDCLRAWEILPEENYYKSGHELETMEKAEAKDSEGAQAIDIKQYKERRKMDVSLCNLRNENITAQMSPHLAGIRRHVVPRRRGNDNDASLTAAIIPGQEILDRWCLKDVACADRISIVLFSGNVKAAAQSFIGWLAVDDQANVVHHVKINLRFPMTVSPIHLCIQALLWAEQNGTSRHVNILTNDKSFFQMLRVRKDLGSAEMELMLMDIEQVVAKLCCCRLFLISKQQPQRFLLLLPS